MASRSLLAIPPELLVHILAFLPVRDLLNFSQTSHLAHSLAKSSLHTLSLGIHSSRVSAIINSLRAIHHPRPKKVHSAFSSPEHSIPNTPSSRSRRDSATAVDTSAKEPLTDNDPYRVSVLIPDAQAFDYTTLLGFHTALTKSILTRHGGTLRHLDLSLWTLTTPVAKALSGLPALRALSVRIEDFPHVRSVPRRCIAAQRVEQREAWNLVANTAVWAPRLDALRIEGAELNTAQLSTLLRRSRWCRELWLCKCAMVGTELWAFLGSEWEGRAALRILSVTRCGGQLDEDTMNVIGAFRGLQFLCLQDCSGVASEAVEQRNKEHWRIPECIPPLPLIASDGERENTVIEVDPLYLTDEEL